MRLGGIATRLSGRLAVALAVVMLVTVNTLSPEPALAVQTAATGAVMRMKLSYMKSILEAIMTSNYGELERHTTALSRITESAGWWVLQSPEYRLQSSAFLRATQDLVEAARRRDLDGAATAYGAVIQKCYACHKYMKGLRIASPLK